MSQEHSWLPTAKISTLKKRADFIYKIREFFKNKDVLEVDTPLVCKTSSLDPEIKPIHIENKGFLQTSPEFCMKKLLAASSGCIYQICKAFRDDELGRLHNIEFTMLEWYRVGFNHFDLMDEIDELLQIFGFEKTKRYSYQEIFEKYLDINPHIVTIKELKKLAQRLDIQVEGEFDLDNWLMILMNHKIEPHLVEPTFIYNYPKSQAALSKINNNVAERFELYIDGIEIANGYHELTDAKQQKERFLKEQKNNTKNLEIDNDLIKALEYGLPDCSGVALGIDRLIMIALKHKNIKEVISF